MSFKSNRNWSKYGRKGEIIEITIKDNNEQKIGDFKCFNNNDYSKVTKIIRDKFGYYPDWLNNEELKESKQETDWLKKDWEW